MSESNIRTVARLLTALDEIERKILNEALPCAGHLKIIPEMGELWQKLEDAGLAAREFLNNHNAVIEPNMNKGFNHWPSYGDK